MHRTGQLLLATELGLNPEANQHSGNLPVVTLGGDGMYLPKKYALVHNIKCMRHIHIVVFRVRPRRRAHRNACDTTSKAGGGHRRNFHHLLVCTRNQARAEAWLSPRALRYKSCWNFPSSDPVSQFDVLKPHALLFRQLASWLVSSLLAC